VSDLQQTYAFKQMNITPHQKHKLMRWTWSLLKMIGCPHLQAVIQ